MAIGRPEPAFCRAPLTLPNILRVSFTDEQMAAIDAWIARHDEPRPSREDAVRQLVAGRLGAYGPCTILPQEVTGRDIS